MTNKEAIKWLREAEILDLASGNTKDREAVDVAISALRAQGAKTQLSAEGTTSDLISRRVAVDALGERPMVWTDDDQYALGERNQYDIDRLAIETLPSAQPDGWLEQNKDKILQAGMEGREIDFRIGGRLFAIREKAQ